MALAETAELAVRLSLDDKLSPALKTMNGRLTTLGSTIKGVGRGVAIGLGVTAAAGVGILTASLRTGIAALKEDQVAAAQTAAVLKSTAGAAGITADQVAKLADELGTLDGLQDNVVQGAENLLLTFTNIGSDIFPQVTAAALDMAAALGTDVNSAAKTLGKALQDPVKGMTALRRAGVILTDQQQTTIKNLLREGKLREAQAVILGEVEKKYHGVAQAQADADPSRRLSVAVEKLQKRLAQGLLPVIEKIQVRLTEWLSKPETLATIQKIGDAIGGLFTDQNLDTIASSLETAAKAVSVAISAFNALPAPIKALAVGAFAINKVTGGAVGGLAGGLGKVIGAGLSKIFAANVTVIGGNVTGGGGGLGGVAENVATGAGAGGVTIAAASAAAFTAIVASPAYLSWFAKTFNPNNDPNNPAGRSFNPGATNVGGLPPGVHTGSRTPPMPGIGHQETAAIVGAVRDMDKDLPTAGSVLARLYGARTVAALAGLNRQETGVQHHIDAERNRLVSLQTRLHAAREAHETARAARLRDKIQNVKSDIDRSNARLAAIQHKKTTFTAQINNTFAPVLSVRSFQERFRSTYRISKQFGQTG